MENIKFENLNLKSSILKAISDLGYEEPSQIQAQSIPLAIEGFDLIGQAQTGTGKTAAFGCALLNNIKKSRNVGALILAPTRELALQVNDELLKLAKYEKLSILPVYGGDSISKQIKALRNHVDVVVGTPGRVLDLMRRGVLKLDAAQFLVLDEADEMLNMGFIEDIQSVIDAMPDDRQTLLFSATMPPQIKKLANKYMKADAQHVEIKKVAMTVSKIKQAFFEVNSRQKLEALCRVLDFENPNAAIIFCKTKRGVDELVESLQSKNYVVEGMHGDMSQQHRTKTLKRFKDGALSFLVATDVAARGIDVEAITHVFNYDLPQDVESYVHRIGRTGRANREGTAYSFVTPREKSMIREIKRVTKGDIPRADVPSVSAILSNKMDQKLKTIEDILNNKAYKKYLSQANSLLDNFDAEDCIAALMKLAFDNEMSYEYTDDKLVEPESDEIRLFFSIGRRDNLNVKTLIKYIADTSGVPGSKINKIDIMESFSFVTVDKSSHEKIMNKCIGTRINKRKVNVEIANKR